MKIKKHWVIKPTSSVSLVDNNGLFPLYYKDYWFPINSEKEKLRELDLKRENRNSIIDKILEDE